MERAANDQRDEPEEQLSEQTHTRAAPARAAIERLAALPQDEEPVVGAEDYLETLKVLVTLAEQLDGDRGGHSMRVARICRRFAEGMALAPEHAHGISIAAYLHDVGIPARDHVTAFDAAKDCAKRDAALRAHTAPNRLFQSVSLPRDAVQTLEHRFERFDGSGFPDGLAGNDIPLGARMLAVAESYVDLTSNQANALGRRLAAEDAYDAVAQLRGAAFDPEVVGWLRDVAVEHGSDMTARMAEILGDSPRRRHGGRGVSGSLQEMALPDLIQILANGRKSGRLEVSHGSLRGEMVFHRGSIHDARLADLQGADAVYALLRFTDGSFSLVPTDEAVEDAIGIPTQHLLLEAMRRLDEDQR